MRPPFIQNTPRPRAVSLLEKNHEHHSDRITPTTIRSTEEVIASEMSVVDAATDTRDATRGTHAMF